MISSFFYCLVYVLSNCFIWEFSSTFGLHTLFWIHGFVCLTMIFIVYFTLPETQGKTLTQLENIYAKERKDDHPKIEMK